MRETHVGFGVMASLRTALSHVLSEYPVQRLRPFAANPLADYIRKDLAATVSEVARLDHSFKVTGSPGKGNWAETPWVALFDLLVTNSATRGYYIVYLFKGDGSGVFLSLNQGATEVRNKYRKTYRDVLAANAKSLKALLTDWDTDYLISGSLDLGRAQAWLTRGYATGNVVARYYPADALPSDESLAVQLETFLLLYHHLVEARDLLADDADPASARQSEGSNSLAVELQPALEAKTERWHRRVERNPRLAKQAKKYHGATCQVCGFVFAERYGEIGDGFIEAHHLVPFADLRGRPKELDPRTDFAVLCSNCHRMIHTSRPPLGLRELRSMLRDE
jgi:5-methylcytosine-specific restriction enzyme A